MTSTIDLQRQEIDRLKERVEVMEDVLLLVRNELKESNRQRDNLLKELAVLKECI